METVNLKKLIHLIKDDELKEFFPYPTKDRIQIISNIYREKNSARKIQKWFRMRSK